MVNLDIIFSNLHHIAPPKGNVGHISGTEISLGKADPARKVQTSGDWTVAWHAATKAVMFAFPHRGEELWQWGTTWHQSSQLNNPVHITNLLPSTRLSGQWSGEGRQSSSLTVTSSPTFSQMESKEVQVCGPPSENDPETILQKRADVLTAMEVAITQLEPASIDMPASNASSQDTDRTAALSRIEVAYGMHPKYLCYNLWSGEEEVNFGNSPPVPCLADWTE